MPAIEACGRGGVDVEGPLPADTLFFRAGRGDFDLVVAMYHDQGHGPVKVLGLEAGVNITVGPAGGAHVRGPWHRLRHRRNREGGRAQHARGAPPGRGTRASLDGGHSGCALAPV